MDIKFMDPIIDIPVEYMRDNRFFDLESWIRGEIVSDTHIGDFLPNRIEIIHLEHGTTEDRKSWIINNLKDAWTGTRIDGWKKEVYFFRDDDDALMFKMWWG